MPAAPEIWLDFWKCAKDDKRNVLLVAGCYDHLSESRWSRQRQPSPRRTVCFYVFAICRIEPGTYVIKETNLSTYPLEVSNYDASVDGNRTDPDTLVDKNLIGVTLEPGKEDTDNNFVKATMVPSLEQWRMAMTVLFPMFLSNFRTVPVLLSSPSTTTIDSTAGAYEFTEVEPGTCKVVETNIPAYTKSLSGFDSTSDDDSVNLNKFTDVVFGVEELKPGETDTGNDSVDSDNGKQTTGTMKDDKIAPMGNVLLKLKDSNDYVVLTTLMNGNGAVHVFDNVEPGVYTVVETNPSEYPVTMLQLLVPSNTMMICLFPAWTILRWAIRPALLLQPSQTRMSVAKNSEKELMFLKKETQYRNNVEHMPMS